MSIDRETINGSGNFRSTSQKWNGMSKDERVNTVRELLTRMNTAQAAKELGVSTGTIYNWTVGADGRRGIEVTRSRALQAPHRTQTTIAPAAPTKQWCDMNREEKISAARYLIDTEGLPYAHAAQRVGLSRKTFSNFYLKYVNPTKTRPPRAPRSLSESGADSFYDWVCTQLSAVSHAVAQRRKEVSIRMENDRFIVTRLTATKEREC